MDGNDAARILIVDDEPRNLRLLSDTLSAAGYEVAAAVNGARALTLAKTAAPDLILLDVMMEGIDGYEACRRLKADPSTSDIPVIFLTASSEVSDKAKGLTLGAVDFILKPFNGEELLARVRVHTKLRRLMKGLEAQVNERLAAEAALHELTQELERRVAERTAELKAALDQLTCAQEALRASNAELEGAVARQNEELKRTNERLMSELAERERAEEERAVLQEEIIRTKDARLAELSTPLIPITRTIMVMPLIGVIDAGRARQALEAALRSVHNNRTSVVIIDVTGVTRIDSAVAATLLDTAGALRMLGAKAVITGLRPELAQTLVSLGIDLRSIVTMGTLESGFAYALTLAGKNGRSRSSG